MSECIDRLCDYGWDYREAIKVCMMILKEHGINAVVKFVEAQNVVD